MANCIDRGLQAVEQTQTELRPFLEDVGAIWQTLDPEQGSMTDRTQRFLILRDQFAAKPSTIHQHFAKVMSSFQAGLLVGEDPTLPRDNLQLERWFRNPKGHARRIHGHRHAGASLVQEGASLALVLDAHQRHPGPYSAADLLPYRGAQRPASEQAALARRKTMRQARSSKQRPTLLANLETRYLDSA